MARSARVCVVCRAALPTGTVRRYCSHACVQRAGRMRARRTRACAAAERALQALLDDEPVPAELLCAQCRRPLRHGLVRADARYCSPACRTAAWRARRHRAQMAGPAVHRLGQPSHL